MKNVRWRKWLTAFLGDHRTRTQQSLPWNETLRFEPLEERQLLAVYAVGADLQITRIDALDDSQVAARQVVFIESAIAGADVLAHGVTEGTDAVLLDSSGDGMLEMAAFLVGRQDLASIHIVAHGAPAQIDLGTATLSQQTLDSYATELTVIGAALTPGGELDLWSCVVGAGESGRSLVFDLAAATGASVAAADHAVGSAALGGDWQLNVQAGSAAALAPFTAQVQADFQDLLGTWASAGSLFVARDGRATVELPFGGNRAMVIGGLNSGSGYLKTAESFDGSSSWGTLSHAMSLGRAFHSATFLNHTSFGVLVAGGEYAGGGFTTNSVEIYDSFSFFWSAGPSMNFARKMHTATELADGRVLVTGGQDQSNILSSAEVYNGSGWTTSSMSAKRYDHTATLLNNGKVLIAGGFGGASNTRLSSAELYDPATNTFTPTNSMSVARQGATATKLSDGRVLVAGGVGAGATAEIFNPATNTWSSTGAMPSDRYYHTATLLGNGKVLIAGGISTLQSVATAAIYNPVTNTWSATNSMASAHVGASAFVVNPRVIVVGGDNGGLEITSAEAYTPFSQSLSTVSVGSSSIQSGNSTTVTVTVKDANGLQDATSGWEIVLNNGSGTSNGTFSAVTDNGNGTYTATFTGTTAGTATTINAYIKSDGNLFVISSAAPTVTVTPGAASTAQSTVTVSPSSIPKGGTSTVTLTAKDANGNALTGGGLSVGFGLGSGTSNGSFSGVTDLGNGTYRATFTATAKGTARTITATIGGQSVTSTLPTITVTNSPPSIASVSLAPTTAFETSTLTAVPQSPSDPDGDTITYTYEWLKGGVTIAGQTGSALSGASFNKGDVISVRVTPNDGTVNGTAVTSNAVTIQNSAPTLGSASISPTTAFETSTLTASPSGGADVDGDTITYSYQWLKGGSPIAGQTSSTLTGANFNKGDVISVRITPNDGTVSGSAVTSSTQTIQNSAPSLSSVNLTPTTAFENSTMTATPVGPSDADGDTVTYSYQWFVNGSLVAGQTGSTLTGAFFNKGNTVQARVTPGDGAASGTQVNSNTVTIQNTLPTLGNATLTPTTAFETTTLTATPGGGNDIDGDTISYFYQWFVNGSLIGATTSTLTGANFNKNDSVTVRVTPNDGAGNGSFVTSSAVTILNTAPSISSVSLTNPAYEDSILAPTPVGANDVDGDTITYTYRWFVNGTQIGPTGSTLSPSNFDLNDTVSVRVTPHDGTANGNEVISNTVTIQGVAGNSTELTLAAGNLTITDIYGGGKKDRLTIQSDTPNSRYIVNDPYHLLTATGIAGSVVSGDQHTVTVPYSSVTGTKINLQTLGGNDRVTIDLSLGNFTKAVSYDGGTQTTSDSLTLLGNGAFASVTHSFIDASSGNISVSNNGLFSYTGLEPIFDNLAAADRVFTFTGGAETITLTDAAGANMTIDSTLSESVTFANPTKSISILAGSGNDTISLQGVDASFTGNLSVDGGTETDTITNQLALNLLSGSLTLAAEDVNINQTITAGRVTITAHDLAIASAITANGGITLAPDDDSESIGLGNGSGTFQLTQVELNHLSSTGNVTIGRVTGNATVNIADVNLTGEQYNLAVVGGGFATVTNLNLGGRTVELNSATGANLYGTIVNAGGTLNLIGNGAFNLQASTIQGGTVSTSGGAVLTSVGYGAGGGTLDGVTLNGDLSVPDNNGLIFKGNLTLNGNATVGTNAVIYSVGNQTFGGNGSLRFTGFYSAALSLAADNSTLTIGPGITIHGGSQFPGTYSGAVIGFSDYWSGGANASLINQGNIAADTASWYLIVNPTGNFTNQGSLQAKNGGTLSVLGNWSSNGPLSVTDQSTLVLAGVWNAVNLSASGNGTIYASGTWTNLGNATFSATAGSTINLNGTGNNTGHTLTLTGNGAFNLPAGTLRGGNVTETAGAVLTSVGYGAGGGTLDGVTLNGDLSVPDNNGLIFKGNLTLNGTATVGTSSVIYSVGNQTFGGNGSLLFAGHSAALSLSADNSTLTIGPGITIHGGSQFPGTYSGAVIGFSDYWSGGANASLINQGTIAADVAGKYLYINPTGNFSNQGSLQAKNGGTLSVLGNWNSSGPLSVTDQSLLNLAGVWNTVNLTATGNGTINAGGMWSNPGNAMFSATAGSTINLNGTGNNTGHTLTLTGNGAFNLPAGTIQGGNVTETAGAVLTSIGYGAGGGTLDGVRLNGNLSVPDSNGLNFKGNLTLNGTVTVGTNAVIYSVGNQTLAGSGSIEFTGHSSALSLAANDSTLTIGPGITIHGGSPFAGTYSGAVVGYSDYWGGGTNASLINQGTIAADVAGRYVYIYPTGNFSNQGSLLAQNGGTLTVLGNWNSSGPLSVTDQSTLNLAGVWNTVNLTASGNGVINAGGVWTNPGNATFSATAGSTINLNGAGNNTGHILTLTGSGAFYLPAGTIQGGTITETAGAVLTSVGYGGGGGTLDGVTVNGNLSVPDSNGLIFKGNLTLNGTVTVGTTSVIYSVGNQTLGGNGSVEFTGHSSALSVAANDTTLTIGPGITIHGGSPFAGTYSGAVVGYSDYWGGGTNASLINQGTIAADVAGRYVYIYPTGNFSNQGSLQAKNGGTLTVLGNWNSSGPLSVTDQSTLNLAGVWNTVNLTASGNGVINAGGVWTNPGNATFSATAGSTINLNGAGNNTGRTLTLTGNGAFNLPAGTIQGGTVTETAGAVLTSVGYGAGGGTLDGVTLNGNLSVPDSNGLIFKGNLTLNGTATVGTNAVIYAVGNQTLGGSGNVVFSGFYSTALSVAANDTTLTIGPGITIRGGSQAPGTYSGAVLGFSDYWGGGSNASIINQGTIAADVAGWYMYINPTGNFSNLGSLRATNGGSLTVYGNWQSMNPLSVNDASTMNLYGNWTGVNLSASGGGVIYAAGTWTNTGNVTFSSTGGTINLTAEVTNAGKTLNLTGNGAFNLSGSPIHGGNITETSGAKLTSFHGTLDGVTLNGDMELASGFNFTFMGGLTLNGTATVGFNSQIYAQGNQTLGGTGNVLFNDSQFAGLVIATNDTTLTIGPNFTIHGGSPSDGGFSGVAIGRSDLVGGGTNANLVNQGTIHSDLSGRYLTVQPSGNFTNTGTLSATSGATLTVFANVAAGNLTRVAPGLLAVGGNVAFAAGKSFDVKLDGTTPGSQYGQLLVSGSQRTVALNGATLNLSKGSSFTPTIGGNYTIIDNSAHDSAVSGTFQGLPEGAYVSAGSSTFTISYHGGAGGNDVVLTQVLESATAQVIEVRVTGEPSVIEEGERLVSTIAVGANLKVTFAHEMSVVGGTSGTGSVINLANWVLTRNGVDVSSQISGISYSGQAATLFLTTAQTSGDFVLTAKQSIQDTDGNALDGDANGTAGGNFVRNFQISPPVAVGSEFRVNTYTTGMQRTYPESPGAIAMDAAGNFVITWTSADQDTSGSGVFAQRYNAAGLAQGGEFQVNSFVAGTQVHAAVAMDTDGDFVITWTSYGQDGSISGVFAQRYNAAGVAQGGEFQVNTYTTGIQRWSSVAMDSDGDFVITWTSTVQDASSYGVYAQRYNAAGAAQGGEFRVNAYTTGVQQISSVAMDSDGDFVITWTSSSQDGSGWGVFAQRYNAAGMTQGDEFQVNTTTASNQWFSTVAMDSGGDFVIAWHSFVGSNVYARRYDAAGVAQTGEFQVNTYTTNSQVNAAVAMDADGDFVITWASSGQDGSGYGVYGQRYSPVGVAQGTEFKVSTFTTGGQNYSAVAMDSDGDFVVAWSSIGQDGSDYGVYAQRYSLLPAGTTSLTLDGANNLVITDTAAGGQNDTLTIKSDTTNSVFIISDPNNLLGTSIAGATGSGTHTLTIPFASVAGPQISVLTLAGDDSLTVDYSLGNFNKTIFYDGGTQTTSDSMSLTGGGMFLSVGHTFTNASSGSVSITGNSLVSYTGLEPITDNLSAGFRAFTFAGGAETITLDDAAGANMTIDSTLGESVTFANPFNLLSISAGSGDDTISVNSVDAAFAAVVNIDGEAGTDTVNLNAALNVGANAITITAEQINVGGGNITTNGGAVSLNGKVALTGNLTIDTNSDNSGTSGAVTISTGNASVPTIYGQGDGIANLNLTIDTRSNNAVGGNVNLGRVQNNDGAVAGNEYLAKLTINASGTTKGVISLTRDANSQSISVDGNGSLGGINLNGIVAIAGNTYLDTNQTAGKSAGSIVVNTAIFTSVVGGANLTLDTSATGAGQGGAIQFGEADDVDGTSSTYSRIEGLSLIATDAAGPTGQVSFSDTNSDGVSNVNVDGGGVVVYSSSIQVLANLLSIDLFGSTPFNTPGNVFFTDAANTWNTVLSGNSLRIDASGIVPGAGVIRLPKISALNGIDISTPDFAIELKDPMIRIAADTLSAIYGNVTLDGDISLTRSHAITLSTPGSQYGTLAFAAGNDLTFPINGPAVDTDYPQLDVTGLINLAGVNLVISGSYAPLSGQNFTLIDNLTDEPIAGTFNNLPEGSIVSVGGVNRRITYRGGDGNDVALYDLPLQIVSVTPTTTGFAVVFNQPIDLSTLNLYDETGALGAADVTLTNSALQPIRGSMVFSDDARRMTFIQSQGVLPADNYSIRLRSGNTSFVSATGLLLDGNLNGTAGDDYVGNFTVAPSGPTAVTLSIPNITRGFGQSVNVPASGNMGIPITISSGDNVSGLEFTLRYDPTLLHISNVTTAPGISASLVYNDTKPGIILFSVSSGGQLTTQSGPVTLVNLIANVPTGAPYGAKQVLDLTNLQIYESAAPLGLLPAIDDDGVHIAAYFGDANGSQSYNAPDASAVQRMIVGFGTGFSAYPMADPYLIADITGNGQLQSDDVTQIQRAIVGLSTPNIPPFPGLSPIASGGPDPIVSIPQNLTASVGQSVTVPVELLVTESTGITLAGADLAIAYDTSALELTDADVGQLLIGFGLSVNTSTPGLVRLSLGGSPLDLDYSARGVLATLQFTVIAGAGTSSRINLLQSAELQTALYDAAGNPLTLSPAPTNSDSDQVDGGVNIAALTDAAFAELGDDFD